jgi:UDP:flavonoid glycosyltransferase YjiC (YdhE family)
MRPTQRRFGIREVDLVSRAMCSHGGALLSPSGSAEARPIRLTGKRCGGVVVATTGRRLDPDELGPMPANAVVAEFVPQAALLQRADLLVSHSGSGTMPGGLVHGVPQVALPRGTDQPHNAALLARAGAGVVVAPEDYAIPTIRAAVAEVTGDPAFRAEPGVADQLGHRVG